MQKKKHFFFEKISQKKLKKHLCLYVEKNLDTTEKLLNYYTKREFKIANENIFNILDYDKIKYISLKNSLLRIN